MAYIVIMGIDEATRQGADSPMLKARLQIGE